MIDREISNWETLILSKNILLTSDSVARMALNEMSLMRETASVNSILSEGYLLSFELNDQNVRHSPYCYLVVAGHAPAMRAIDLRIRERLIPSRLFGRLPRLGSLYHFSACVCLLTDEHGDPLSDSAF